MDKFPIQIEIKKRSIVFHFIILCCLSTSVTIKLKYIPKEHEITLNTWVSRHERRMKEYTIMYVELETVIDFHIRTKVLNIDFPFV